MDKNKKDSGRRIIYSTDPSFGQEREEEMQETPPPASQRLRAGISKKGRAGKTVTVVTGFSGNPRDLEALGRELRSHCGTGGSVKEGQILLQGDVRDKVVNALLKAGYQAKKAGG